MNKFVYLVLTFILASIFSCSKMPTNGELDGQWQLLEINTRATESDPAFSQTLSKKNDRIYWSFQLDLLMVQETKETPLIFARFNHAEQFLDITKIYKNSRNEDSLITDPNTTMLIPIGIQGNAEKFKVEKLSSKHMILTTKFKQLVFKKLG